MEDKSILKTPSRRSRQESRTHSQRPSRTPSGNRAQALNRAQSLPAGELVATQVDENSIEIVPPNREDSTRHVEVISVEALRDSLLEVEAARTANTQPTIVHRPVDNHDPAAMQPLQQQQEPNGTHETPRVADAIIGGNLLTPPTPPEGSIHIEPLNDRELLQNRTRHRAHDAIEDMLARSNLSPQQAEKYTTFYNNLLDHVHYHMIKENPRRWGTAVNSIAAPAEAEVRAPRALERDQDATQRGPAPQAPTGPREEAEPTDFLPGRPRYPISQYFNPTQPAQRLYPDPTSGFKRRMYAPLSESEGMDLGRDGQYQPKSIKAQQKGILSRQLELEMTVSYTHLTLPSIYSV